MALTLSLLNSGTDQIYYPPTVDSFGVAGATHLARANELGTSTRTSIVLNITEPCFKIAAYRFAGTSKTLDFQNPKFL